MLLGVVQSHKALTHNVITLSSTYVCYKYELKCELSEADHLRNKHLELSSIVFPLGPLLNYPTKCSTSIYVSFYIIFSYRDDNV